MGLPVTGSKWTWKRTVQRFVWTVEERRSAGSPVGAEPPLRLVQKGRSTRKSMLNLNSTIRPGKLGWAGPKVALANLPVSWGAPRDSRAVVGDHHLGEIPILHRVMDQPTLPFRR